MKWVNATLGIIPHPPTVTISRDMKSLEGLLYARVFNGFYQAAKVDLKIVPISGDYGRCAEGGVNHTGAYLSLLSNESNFGTILFDNLQCDDLLDIEVGPLQLDYEQTLASLRDPKRPSDNETADFTEIFKTVDLAIYILYIIVLLIVFKLWKFAGRRENKKQKKRLKRRKKRKFDEWAHLGAMREQREYGERKGKNSVEVAAGSGRSVGNIKGVLGVSKANVKKKRKKMKNRPQINWNLITITFNQFNGNPESTNLRIVVLFYMLFIFWIFQFLFASFKSDLLVEKPVKFIDSLEDLANSDEYHAVFVNEYNAWRRFEESDDPVVQKIWQKAIKKYEKYGKYGTHENPDKNGTITNIGQAHDIFTLLNNKRVSITVRAVSRFTHLLRCFHHDEGVGMDNFTTVHQATDPLLSHIKVMVAFGPSITTEAKARLTWAYRVFNENGISTYYHRNPQGILNLYHRGQAQCVMAVENMKNDEQTTEGEPPALKPANFKSFPWMFTCLLSLAHIVLIYERKWMKIKVMLSNRS